MKNQYKSTRAAIAACFLTVSLICGIAPVVQATAMDTRWQDTTRNQQELLRAAERTLKAAGFTQHFSIAGQSVFEARGDYLASIRCVASKRVVFFLVTGPDTKECERLNARLEETFQYGDFKEW
jgi:hypothetical protein